MEEQLEVVRAISSYSKTTERLVDEAGIGLTLEQLKAIFTPDEDDPLMYGVYPIDQYQANQLRQLDNAIQLYTEEFDYQLECYQANT